MDSLSLTGKNLRNDGESSSLGIKGKNDVQLNQVEENFNASAIDSIHTSDKSHSRWDEPSMVGISAAGTTSARQQSNGVLGSEGGSGGNADAGDVSDDSIVIHIYDESRGVKKDFDCSRRLLLEHMKYFKSYIPDQDVPEKGGGTEAEDIDISVHCDIYIFEFLVGYMKSPHVTPKFETSSVVSILISSEFLQMDELVVKCLRFIAQNLDSILLLPVDLSCISDAMCSKLAKLCPAEALVGAVDKKGKLLPRLYKKRLEIDFREKSPRIHPTPSQSKKSSTSNSSCLICCRHCYRLFPETEVAANGGYIRCQMKASSVAVGFHGELVGRECEPVSEWSLTNFVASLRRQQLEWSNIYWMLWSAAHMLRVDDGGLIPSDSESSCRCHKKPPTFASATFGSAAEVGLWGVYPCCGETALKLNPWELKSERGCGSKALRLAPAFKFRPSQPHFGMSAGRKQFFNDDSRLRIAAKARSAFGPGFGTRFQKEVKVALDELVESASAGSTEPPTPVSRTNSGGTSNNWALVRSSVNSRGGSGAPGGSNNKRTSNTGVKGATAWKSENPYEKGDLVCTTSMRVGGEIKKFSAFVNTPLVYRTDAAKAMGLDDRKFKGTTSPGKQSSAQVQIGGASRFVGSAGFTRFASSRGANVNTERYLAAVGAWTDAAEGRVVADDELTSDLLVGGLKGISRRDDISESAARSALNEPIRGLDHVQREVLTRATSSKTALTMDASKRISWYNDAQRQSDVERLRRISSRLASLRNGCDIAEKSSSSGNERERKGGSQVKSKSNFVRGGSWRNGFTIKNKQVGV